MENKDIGEEDHVPSIPPKLLQQWLKSRKRTLIIFAVQNLLLGIDSSFLLMTLLVYLKNLVKTDYVNFFYGMTIFSSSVLPSFLFMPFISKYADRTRNTRNVMFLVHYSLIVGNILYTIYYSAWILVFSRFLTGFGLLSRSVMNGEISRSYLPNELPNKLSFLGMAFMLGKILGPATNFLFFGKEFTVFTLKLNYLNIPGLMMGVLFSILHLCSLKMMSNLSKIYDLKADMGDSNTKKWKVEKSFSDAGENNDDDETSLHHDGTSLQDKNKSENTKTLLVKRKSKDNEVSAKNAYKKILKSSDIVVMLICTCIHTYLFCCYFFLIPMIVIEKLKWTVKSLGWINISIAIASVVPLVLLLRFKVGKTLLYRLGLISQFALLFGQIALMIQTYVRATPLNVLWWVVYCLMVVLVAIADEVFFVGVLAQLVRTEDQIFVDGLRLTCFRLFCGLPSFIAPLLVDRMYIGTIVHILLALVSITLLLAKKRSLQNPAVTY